MHPAGQITKKHGYNGTVVLVANQPLDDGMENLKEIFVQIDGLYVPFPVKELTLHTDTSAHLLLEFADSPESVAELIGCSVYTAENPHAQAPEAGLEQLTGFAVHDSTHGRAGIIQQIEDYSGNIVLQIMDGEKEILISLYPELVTAIDMENRVIHISAPDGYF